MYFTGTSIMLISQGVPPLAASNMGGWGKQAIFEQNATISQQQEIHSKLLLMTNKKLHKRFRLSPRSMTLNDLELLLVRIFWQFRGISQILEPTTAKRMKIDPYRLRMRSTPLSVLFNNMFLALICRIDFFAGAFINSLLSRAYLSVRYRLSIQ